MFVTFILASNGGERMTDTVSQLATWMIEHPILNNHNQDMSFANIGHNLNSTYVSTAPRGFIERYAYNKHWCIR